MRKFKDSLLQFIRTRGVGYILTIPAIAVAIAAMVLYKQTGISVYSTRYNQAIFSSQWAGLILCAISLFTGLIPVKFADDISKVVRTAGYLMLLYAILQYVYTQATFLGAVFVAIDVNLYEPLIPGFISTIVTMGVAAVIALLATVLDSWRPWARKAKQEVNQ